jgi:CubicO group peptidase (beta-lactamase class C family)
MKKLFFTLFSIVFTTIISAQNFEKAKMDSLFKLIDANEKSMGSISIYHESKEVYQYSMGYADVEKKQKANALTKYRVGSVSKIFTSAIILQMVEEGKLNLETTLDRFYPEIPNAKSITIEQLLRHRTGLFNFTNAPEYLEWMEKPKSKEALLELFVKNGTTFEPGDKFEYSNTNYVLLSFIVETIDGKSFAEILKQRIAVPLALTNTYYGGKIDPARNEAKSYTRANTWVQATETDMSIPTGAGAIVSAPSDLNLFLIALFSGKVISNESLSKMKEMKDGYGLGLIQFPFFEKKAFGHTGGIDGFQSSASFFPDENIAITMLVNGASMPSNDILIGALSIYFGRDYKLPEFTPAILLTAEELSSFTGTYSSEGFPLKITISQQGGALFGQATGQPMFPLEAFEKNKFRFDPAKLVIEFYPEENKLLLLQGGGRFELTRE